MGWPGMLRSLQSPRLLCFYPLAVLFMAGVAALLGRFQRAEKDTLGSPGFAAEGQGITGSIGGNRGSGSTVCPSHLDSPPAKVKYFKEAQGDDLVNGCVTQVLPCGVGFFVSLILLFTPVGNHWG